MLARQQKDQEVFHDDTLASLYLYRHRRRGFARLIWELERSAQEIISVHGLQK